MFYGTKFRYNLLYFLTAMSPAYFLFLLQVNKIFNKPFDKQFFGICFDIYKWCLVLFFILLMMTLILIKLLKRQYIRGLGNPVLTKDLCKFSKLNIEKTNGNVISFLLGNIIPVVLIIENSLRDAMVVFIILQVLIFILTMKSSDIFPNIMLIICGLDISKTKDGNYLLILNGTEKNLKNVYQLGDAEKSKLYITSYKK